MSLEYYVQNNADVHNMVRIDPYFKFHVKIVDVIRELQMAEIYEKLALDIETHSTTPIFIVNNGKMEEAPDTDQMKKVKLKIQEHRDNAYRIFNERTQFF